MELNLPTLKQALTNQDQKNNIISNNLANLNTIGYKRDLLFSEKLADTMDEGFAVKQETDHTQGQLKETKNALDLAILGRGFFTVETQDGYAYTRDGHFKMDSEGYLRTLSGHPVMGSNGLVFLRLDEQPAKEISISEEGEIFVDGESVNQLLISDFESYDNLKKAGDNLFTSTMDAEIVDPEKTRIQQGFLEESNVNPVQEMIDLIEVQRQFESVQTMVRNLDRTFDLAVNQVGKF